MTDPTNENLEMRLPLYEENAEDLINDLNYNLGILDRLIKQLSTRLIALENANNPNP